MKSWYASKTIWGAILVLVGLAAQSVGYQIAPEDQQKIVEIIARILEAFGGLIAIYGRIKASKDIAPPTTKSIFKDR